MANIWSYEYCEQINQTHQTNYPKKLTNKSMFSAFQNIIIEYIFVKTEVKNILTNTTNYK